MVRKNDAHDPVGIGLGLVLVTFLTTGVTSIIQAAGYIAILSEVSTSLQDQTYNY